MEIEAKKPEATWNPDSLENCPSWTDLGVDFSPYPKDWLRLKIMTHGQIGLLYGIMASLGARPLAKEDSRQVQRNKLAHVERALSEPFISPNAKRRLDELAQSCPDRLPVPWFRRYIEDATAKEVELIERCSSEIFRGDHSFVEKLFSAKGPAYLRLCAKGVIQPRLRIYDEFEAATVVIWLDFLVNGHNDPTLCPAFERYRPDRLKDHAAFVAAYEELFGADSTKSISH
jgi:hypothetical protein